MTEYVFRKALPEDAKKISNLIHLAGINPADLSWKRFIIAQDETGEVVGCGQVKPHGGEMRELASIAVHPAHRGKKIARQIIERLLNEHPRPLYLMCLARNGGLYQKFGFQILSYEEMPRYFRRIKKLFDLADVFRKTGEELLVMKLE